MQAEVGLKCMQINFGGHGLFSFGDFTHFCLPSKWPKFPFRPWGSKNRIGSKKFMQVEVDLNCIETNFDGFGGLFGFGDCPHFHI